MPKELQEPNASWYCNNVRFRVRKRDGNGYPFFF